MAFIYIDYEDGDQSTYKSVELSYEDGEKHSFNTGDLTKDWYNAIKLLITGEKSERGMLSSSVDHFIMDGDNYKLAWLTYPEPDQFELSYTYVEDRLRFFIPKNITPTWLELKEICK